MKLNFLLIVFSFCSGFAFAGKGPVARIPFELLDSRIVVSLKINDSPKTLRMLFDTGADGVGLKKSVADEIGVTESRRQTTQVVGASMQVAISEKNTLIFDTLKISNQNIAIFPEYRDDLDGLFGSAFLRRYLTNIDFDQSVIELYPFGELTCPEDYERIPLNYTGLPGLKARVELNSGKSLETSLFFDTGASYPLIFFGAAVHKNELEEGFAVQARGTTVSMGHSTPTASGMINFLELGKTKLEHFTGTLQTSSGNDPKFAEEADGSLGIEIIRKFNWYIDLAKKEFHLKPNKNFNQPMPFWLGDYFVALSEEKLKVISVALSPDREQSPLQTGDVIETMNEEVPLKFILSGAHVRKDAGKLEIELVVSRRDVQFLAPLIIK